MAKIGRSVLKRGLLLAAAGTLLQTNACVEIIQRTTINGFFDFLIPLLAQQSP